MNNIYTLREHASTSVRCIVEPLPKIQPPRSMDFSTPAPTLLPTQRSSDALQMVQVEGKKIVIVPTRSVKCFYNISLIKMPHSKNVNEQQAII